MTNIMRFLLVLAGLFSSLISFGQIEYLTVGINGLTCSQCSRSVELQLRKLDFIKDVDMNLQQTEGRITLQNSHTAIPFEAIAGAVKDAGFSIRLLKITFTPEVRDQLTKGKDIQVGANRFFIINIPGHSESNSTFQFVGKIFMPSAIYKKYSKWLPSTPPQYPPYRLIPSGE